MCVHHHVGDQDHDKVVADTYVMKTVRLSKNKKFAASDLTRSVQNCNGTRRTLRTRLACRFSRHFHVKEVAKIHYDKYSGSGKRGHYLSVMRQNPTRCKCPPARNHHQFCDLLCRGAKGRNDLIASSNAYFYGSASNEVGAHVAEIVACIFLNALGGPPPCNSCTIRI